MMVSGRPVLTLSVGTGTRDAAFESLSDDRTELWFKYLVMMTDMDSDGISVTADALNLNGGAIQDRTGETANLNLGSHAIAEASGHRVNAFFRLRQVSADGGGAGGHVHDGFARLGTGSKFR